MTSLRENQRIVGLGEWKGFQNRAIENRNRLGIATSLFSIPRETSEGRERAIRLFTHLIGGKGLEGVQGGEGVTN